MRTISRIDAAKLYSVTVNAVAAWVIANPSLSAGRDSRGRNWVNLDALEAWRPLDEGLTPGQVLARFSIGRTCLRSLCKRFPSLVRTRRRGKGGKIVTLVDPHVLSRLIAEDEHKRRKRRSAADRIATVEVSDAAE